MIESIVVGATLGFASSAHCVVMCGPLVAGGCTQDGAVRPRLALGYALGRTVGYATLGGVAATLGHPFVGTGVARGAQLAAAFGVALVLVVTAVRWLRPALRPAGAPPRLIQLRPRRGVGRIVDAVPRRGLGLGLATSLFPCGALASGVLAAAASGSWPAGVTIMTAFSLASLPALGLVVLFGDRIARALRAQASGSMRVAASVAMLGVALWIAAGPFRRAALATSKEHACCAQK